MNELCTVIKAKKRQISEYYSRDLIISLNGTVAEFIYRLKWAKSLLISLLHTHMPLI